MAGGSSSWRSVAASWRPVWSVPAALRAVRAAIVVPGLFAFADQVLDNLQVATFAAFGGFATLVLVSFGGTRREKLMAHLALALAGSALIAIGTAVSSTTVLAALVTVPVAFAVFFAGVCWAERGRGGERRPARIRAPRRLGGNDRHDPRTPRGLVAGVGRGHGCGDPSVTAGRAAIG